MPPCLSRAWEAIARLSHYGQLALELAEADGQPWVQNRVRLIWLATLAHRVWPLSKTLEPLRQTARRALSIGDVTTGVIAALMYAQHATTAHCDYPALLEELRRMGEGIAWHGLSALRLDYMMELQYLQKLCEESPDPTMLTGDYWDESAALADLRSQANHAFLASYHVLKAHLAYLHHDYTVALQHVEAGRRGSGALRQRPRLPCFVDSRFVGSAGRGRLWCPPTGAEDNCGRSLQTSARWRSWSG